VIGFGKPFNFAIAFIEELKNFQLFLMYLARK